MSGHLGQYFREVRTLMRGASGFSGVLSLLRVRLALSKVGMLTSLSPHMSMASTKHLGKRLLLRSHATAIAVLLELVSSNSYERVPRLIPGPLRAIVDLVANVGIVSRWLLERYPGAKLVTAERA